MTAPKQAGRGGDRANEGKGRRGGAGSSRRRAREVALQVLYAIDLIQDRKRPPAPDEVAGEEGSLPSVALEELAGQSPEQVFDTVVAHFPIPEKACEFARELVAQVRQNSGDLDQAITQHSRNWRITRMAAVDRNILRLGVYELTFTDTPAPVILNESIDLARRFSGDPSPAFVNGILDAVARTTREPDT